MAAAALSPGGLSAAGALAAADTAVIINEFGEIGLDHLLVEKSDDEGMVTLNSGCLCCTVRGDLVQALEGLFEKRSAGKLDFDRIVIETTGLADPAPILHTLIVTPGLGMARRRSWFLSANIPTTRALRRHS